MNNETIVEIESAQKEKKPCMLKTILTTLVFISFLFLSFIAYGAAVPNQFYKLLIVTSGSMSPTFEAGDLIMIVKSDSEKLKTNDIITFQTKSGKLLTHRVMEIKPDGEIVTKGDANNAIDSWPDGWKLEKAETIYVAKIPVFGRVISSLQGLFVEDTGAWLHDTEKIAVSLNASYWEVEPILDSEILVSEPGITLIPESELILTPEPPESILTPESPLEPETEPILTPEPPLEPESTEPTEPTLESEPTESILEPVPDPTEQLDSRLLLEPIIIS